MNFQNGDKVRFESVHPLRKGTFHEGTVTGSSHEPVGDGTERFGYWVNTGKSNHTWVKAENLEPAKK